MRKTSRFLSQRRKAYRRGLYGEIFAIWALRFKGYRLIRHRFRSPVGEVDLILKKSQTLVIVEVKSRSNLRDGLESVTPRKQNKLRQAAQAFLAICSEYSTWDVRFDVVVQMPWRWPRHFINVF